MNAAPFLPLLSQFADNWRTNAAQFTVSITGQEIEVDDNHPIQGELVSLCSGRPASLPFFAKPKEVVWCTLAPDSDSLRQAVVALHAWVLPSFGGELAGDGYISPSSAKSTLASAIISVAPGGYYRWRCPRQHLDKVCEKLRLRHGLEAVRPARSRSGKPSLYELRARFASALLVGDRESAEKTIELLDALQLETALNTQFMRIRLWHHFHEYERIQKHRDLPHLLAQPLPPRVKTWIEDALGTGKDQSAPTAAAVATAVPPSVPPAPPTWSDWFLWIKAGDKEKAELFLQERPDNKHPDLASTTIDPLTRNIEELCLDDTLRNRERTAVMEGLGRILEEFVREPEFPRANLGDFYFAVLQLWGAIHAGNSVGQEHGNVLLELANAALQLNRHPDAVRGILEDWWKARPTPSQLPYALDAIELLERELPKTEATANLWVDAADIIKRTVIPLAPSDSELWRTVGLRLGFDENTISQYLPREEPEQPVTDPLASAALEKVAIVCLREKQAQEAASIIQKRSGAQVNVVTATEAGPATTQARTADVVLFVWMASTHAVFRAFDGFDRKKLCYVQGTGASSIVRCLERWVTSG